jgi:hypothetical protein
LVRVVVAEEDVANSGLNVSGRMPSAKKEESQSQAIAV